jgi:hypothetical protein
MIASRLFIASATVVAGVSLCFAPQPSRAASTAVLGWNNLGMHCMDSDYSVFSILPPYNTIEAQLIVGGKLVTNGSGYTITYQAVADPAGSFNSTSAGKGNFYSFVSLLYGAVPVDAGLAGWNMPGTNNTPQAMLFEPTNFVLVNWFRAEGIPLTPYDDALQKNPYPMMRLVARDAASNVIATSAIVLPVSDEMDCRACHASGSYTNTLPAAGWANDGNPERDYRLNILRLHDERQMALHPQLYADALAAQSFNAAGLYASVVTNSKPILCAICHASVALGTTGYTNVPPLTTSMHARHATAPDPVLSVTLDNALNRAACYRCHPGSTTKCLRGAMGAAVTADGTMAMQCQSCHGAMSQVGAANRIGWLMEPNCQSCHTGPATHNNGEIRYTSVFESNGVVRLPVDQTFATSSNTPAPGLSLYRFSSGHGGLQCEACHGSTHAEFPSTHLNDNVRNVQLQGHAGVLVECTACHVTMPNTVAGGPHGMHPVGQSWVNQHGDAVESGSATRAQCQACHGTDYRGTVLSRAQADRQLIGGSDSGTDNVRLFRGAVLGCYLCHNGPNSESMNTSPPPVVINVATNTAVDQSVAIHLPATGTNLTLSIVAQPAHGAAGLNGQVATYFPDPGFVGIDSFTFAAYDGAKNSALATGTIGVGIVLNTTPPTITILMPTGDSIYAAYGNVLTLSGTAADDVAVTGVSWSSDRGGSGDAKGTTNWSISLVPLLLGVNVITVTARDAINNTGTDTLTVTLSPASSLLVLTSGNGTVTPNLNGQNLTIGKSYTLTAKPGSGSVFAKWTGSIPGITPSLTFVMQNNLVLQANFVPNPFVPVAGSYNGLFSETNEVLHPSSGNFTISVTKGGSFSGQMQNGPSRYSLKGQFDVNGHAHVIIPRKSMNPLTVELQLDLTHGTDHLTGTVSDPTWTADLAGDRAVYNGKTSVAPQQGKYTMIFGGDTDSPDEPYGFSYATVTVDAAGRIKVSGSLSDATKISGQTTLAKDGRWPFYLLLYNGQGCALGWLVVTNAPADSITGDLSWIKPAQANAKLYRDGFGITTTVSGSRYTQPAAGQKVLQFTDGKVVLEGGNLSQPLTNTITLNANNQVSSTSNKLSLLITLSSGAFKGSVVVPGTTKATSFNGVVLQNRNAGYGYFSGTNQSGKASFGP